MPVDLHHLNELLLYNSSYGRYVWVAYGFFIGILILQLLKSRLSRFIQKTNYLPNSKMIIITTQVIKKYKNLIPVNDN